MRSAPEITDGNETVIEFLDDRADGLGRRRFFAYWLADKVGPRCDQQIFHANPEEFAARVTAKGRTVRHLPPPVTG